jgi:radical SAM protein with 4Fe4S-binding SPASM domain
MSPETHSIYRIKGDLNRVFRNIEETIRLRNEQGSSLRIVCGMILMKHNEHEVELFRQTMDEFGVDEAEIIDPCVRTVAQGKTYLPTDERHWYYDPKSFYAGQLRPRVPPVNLCPWLYYSLTIQVNGDVVPCCRDPKGKHIMGNLLDQDFDVIWNGNQFLTFRRALLSNQAQIGICRLCSSYPASTIK